MLTSEVSMGSITENGPPPRSGRKPAKATREVSLSGQETIDLEPISASLSFAVLSQPFPQGHVPQTLQSRLASTFDPAAETLCATGRAITDAEHRYRIDAGVLFNLVSEY